MATTGETLCNSGANNAGIGATAWTNPSQITVNNGSDATCNAAASSQYLVAYDYSFSITSGSTIDGVIIRVEASEHSAGTESLRAQLQDDTGTLVGSSKTATISGTGKSVYTYGTSTDTWGATLTTSITNDIDFGVRLWFTTAHDVRIDYVSAEVYYTVPSTGNKGSLLLMGLGM